MPTHISCSLYMLKQQKSSRLHDTVISVRVKKQVWKKFTACAARKRCTAAHLLRVLICEQNNKKNRR